MQAAQQERLTLYREAVGKLPLKLTELLKEKDLLKDRDMWREAKKMYEESVLNLYYKDIAETFFNSVYRHVHKGLGVDRELMFVMPSHDELIFKSVRPIYHIYDTNQKPKDLVRNIFNDFPFDAPFEDLERDIDLITHTIFEKLLSKHSEAKNKRLEVLRSVFYRNKGAYIVGRASIGEAVFPFIIPLLHEEKGIYADALLLEYNDVSSIFTYYRSYFLVVVIKNNALEAARDTKVFQQQIAGKNIGGGELFQGFAVVIEGILHLFGGRFFKIEIERHHFFLDVQVFYFNFIPPQYNLRFCNFSQFCKQIGRKTVFIDHEILKKMGVRHPTNAVVFGDEFVFLFDDLFGRILRRRKIVLDDFKNHIV